MLYIDCLRVIAGTHTQTADDPICSVISYLDPFRIAF